VSESEQSVLERLAKVMGKTFHLRDPLAIVRETTAGDVPGWDSLSHALLIMNTEEEFGVQLPLDAVYELNDVGELVDLIRAKLS
jgi:acyl carrier protein